MNHRKAIALLALVGFFLSVYLSMWKMGLMGPIACGEGSCGAVQLSEWAYLFGIPVAYFGVGGYLALTAAAMFGLQPAEINRRRTTTWLVWLSAGGVAFTAYLTFLEAFVIEAWCRYCLVSAGIIAAIFIIALAGTRERLPAEAN